MATHGVGRGLYTFQRCTRESQRPTPREERMLYAPYDTFNVLRVNTFNVLRVAAVSRRITLDAPF